VNPRLEDSALRFEAVAAAGVAAVLAAALVWLGPPGTDLAAHAYQRALFLHHGFELWNNFWYAGRYSFVTYSLLYYPLAAALGISLLGVLTIGLAAYAFSVVVGREWGAAARWSSRTFAVVWACVVVSAAFPFALGAALALLALWALQIRARWRFALLAVLTIAASPLAFLLLVLVVAGIAVERRADHALMVATGATLMVIGTGEVLLWRVFPSSGRFPFSWKELASVCAFCILGAALAWRVERARVLRFVFVVYLAASLVAYAVPSGVGENIARLRLAAIPLAVLLLSLRSWRPRIVAVGVLGFAATWNLTPLAANFVRASQDHAHGQAYWAPAIHYLKANRTPSYRVEAVDTVGHWPAVYLAEAGIPIARGWYRQDDFPQNGVLYSALGPKAYVRWLHGLGVRYVVLTTAPPDYSARAEARILRSARSPFTVVMRTPRLTIFEVPNAKPLVTGPGEARILEFAEGKIRAAVTAPGLYRIAVRFSPYWRPSMGCVIPGVDDMVRVAVPAAGPLELRFSVSGGRAWATLRGKHSLACALDTSPRPG